MTMTSTVRLVTFGPRHSTRYRELDYQRQGDCWRFIDTSTDNNVGPQYPTKDELLADLEQYAANFGCARPPGTREPVPFRDISDKGRKANGRLRYEVLYTDREDPQVHAVESDYTLCAKFSAYGDAFAYAQQLRRGTTYMTEILLRS